MSQGRRQAGQVLPVRADDAPGIVPVQASPAKGREGADDAVGTGSGGCGREEGGGGRCGRTGIARAWGADVEAECDR